MPTNVLITSNCAEKYFFSPITEIDHSTYHIAKVLSYKGHEFYCYMDYCTYKSDVWKLKALKKALWVSKSMGWSMSTWDRRIKQFIVFDRLPVSRNSD